MVEGGCEVFVSVKILDFMINARVLENLGDILLIITFVVSRLLLWLG